MKIKLIGKILVPLALICGMLLAQNAVKNSDNQVKLGRDNEVAKVISFELSDDYNEIVYDNNIGSNDLRYAYKPSSGILRIYDPVSDYYWYSGRDVANTDTMANTCKTTIDSRCDKFEYSSNTVDTSNLNSFFQLTFYNDRNSSDNAASSNRAISKLYAINQSDGVINHLRLDVDFSNLAFAGTQADVQIKIHIYLYTDGYDIEVRYEEFSGSAIKYLSAISITPYLGASGGRYVSEWEPIKTDLLDMKNGYIVVPDGSGSIIPFVRNQHAFGSYSSKTYGPNLARGFNDTNQTNVSIDNQNVIVPTKDLTLPMYGIVHSDASSALIAYATKGEEYMSVNAVPDYGSSYRYANGYASFEYNTNYEKILNKSGGDNASTVIPIDRPNKFDFSMSYRFLNNDDANYSGIARKYREYLFESEILSPQENTYDDIPMRIDFLMADSEKAIVGSNNVVVTTASQVDQILSEINDEFGINEIVTSLYGWQNGGLTLGKPHTAKFTNEIGSANSFKNTISNGKKIGYDISLAQDYLNIYEKQISFNGNASKHYNGYYVTRIDTLNPYIKKQGFARADKATSWMKTQYKEINKKLSLESMTVSGISNRLLSNSTNTTITDNKNKISDAFSYLNDRVKVNADAPNMYLWKYIDRYLNIPVSDSQYTISSEAIPLLQMVLSGSNLEKYANYSNFSFYDKKSMLTMIDFNVLPSFILTHDAAHHLLDTNSSKLYSTEYILYKEYIEEIYEYVNSIQKYTVNDTWVSRQTLDNGLVVNKYASGQEVVLNYTNYSLPYGSITVDANSALRIGGN